MSRSGYELWQGMKNAREQLGEERLQWQTERRSIGNEAKAVDQQIDAAWQHLLEVVLPALDAAALDAVAQRLSLPQVSARNVAQARDVDKQKNEAKLASLRTELAESDARRNEAEIKLAEANEALAPLAESVRELEYELLFRELIESGYGTPAYAGRFWQMSYYRHWKRADEIVAKHGARLGVPKTPLDSPAAFGHIRAKWLAERDAAQTLEAVVREQQDRIARVAAIERDAAEAQRALDTLDARSLAWARGLVREHIAGLPPDETTKLLHGVEPWRVAGTRVLGLQAKKTYLDALVADVIAPFDREAEQAMRDLDRQIHKMSRPKKWNLHFDDLTVEKRLQRKRLDKWRNRRGQLHGTRERIVTFHDYDRYDPVRDLLWWNLMTDHHHMPFSRHEHGHSVFFGGEDDLQLRAAEASGSFRDQDRVDVS